MHVRNLVRSVLLAMCAATLNAAAYAQGGVTVSGRLVNSLSGDPVSNATVQIDELRRTALSDMNGAFTFTDVPAGNYHLSVHSQGYSTRRTELTVPAAAGEITVSVDPELHFEEQTTVTGDARSQFEVYQPTAVLAGQDLQKDLAMALGDTLQNQAGVAVRSFGPATSRPVIRGLDGDRVVILQDGQRTGDLSTQSGDHAVTINPAAAQRIDVVRGPATLLYGSAAIGGLVNVITEDIPTRRVEGATGNAVFDVGTAAKEGGAAADIRAGDGSLALHASGGGRRSGEYATPEGDVLNSQSRNGFGNLGLSWTGERSYFGGSYGYTDAKLGIPVVEEGQVQSTPRAHSFGLRAGGEGLTGAIDSYRATLMARRYKHDELEGEEVGTAFKNDTEEVELMAGHRAAGRLRGRFGTWFLNRAFGATGEEALSPDVNQRGVAAFLFEEVTWPHFSFQIGGRVDHARYMPVNENERSFTTGSGSVGLLFTPAAAQDRLTFAVSVARTSRIPALEEMFYLGPHPGTFAFEIGNPDLTPEHARGLDVSMRWRHARASGEVTYFRNDISDFVFRSPLTQERLEDRLVEFESRFPERDIEVEGIEFPIIEYLSADSILQGIEAHSDFGLTSTLFAEVLVDYVHGALKVTDDPLPRIPPLRAQFGLRYQYNAFQAGGSVTAVAKQNRVFDIETPSDGYGLLRLYAAYSVQAGRAVHTMTARLDNVTDVLYRNHLSYIKDLAPEMGRNFKALYSIRF